MAATALFWISFTDLTGKLNKCNIELAGPCFLKFSGLSVPTKGNKGTQKIGAGDSSTSINHSKTANWIAAQRLHTLYEWLYKLYRNCRYCSVNFWNMWTAIQKKRKIHPKCCSVTMLISKIYRDTFFYRKRLLLCAVCVWDEWKHTAVGLKHKWNKIQLACWEDRTISEKREDKRKNLEWDDIG